MTLAREWKKLWNKKVTVIPIVTGALGTQTIGKRTGGLGNIRTNGDHPNYCIIEIGQNTEKSPGDVSRLVNKIPVKDHRLMVM